MSLPPGFLDELQTRISLSSVVGRKVTWDMRKSNLGKGDMWAPCPFHQEKSASFHVDDRKAGRLTFSFSALGHAKLLLTDRLIASTAPINSDGADEVEADPIHDEAQED